MESIRTAEYASTVGGGESAKVIDVLMPRVKRHKTIANILFTVRSDSFRSQRWIRSNGLSDFWCFGLILFRSTCFINFIG